MIDSDCGTPLIGSQDERYEMPAAGREGLVPRMPIFVRPAVRLDPGPRSLADQVRDAIARGIAHVQAAQSPLWAARTPRPIQVATAAIIAAAVLYVAWQLLRYEVAEVALHG